MTKSEFDECVRAEDAEAEALRVELEQLISEEG